PEKGATGPQGLTLTNSKLMLAAPDIGAFDSHRNGAGPSRSSRMLWTLRLFRDDRNGVDAKDVGPGLNQVCLDDFKFVVRVGFNRGSDAVFALYILGHLPCPPCIPRMEVVEGRRGARPVDPPGVLQRSDERAASSD